MWVQLIQHWLEERKKMPSVWGSHWTMLNNCGDNSYFHDFCTCNSEPWNSIQIDLSGLIHQHCNFVKVNCRRLLPFCLLPRRGCFGFHLSLSSYSILSCLTLASGMSYLVDGFFPEWHQMHYLEVWDVSWSGRSIALFKFSGIPKLKKSVCYIDVDNRTV